MEFQVEALLAERSCRIVFVENPETARAVKAAFLKTAPEYATEIHSAFDFQKKLGPFTVKNKVGVWDTLSKTPKVKANGAAYLMEQIKLIDIYGFEGRCPAALSRAQRERSSVLYEAFCGKRCFLLSDLIPDLQGEGEIFNPLCSHYLSIAKWMVCYEDFSKNGFDLIWITGMPREDLLERMCENGLDLGAFSFFEMEENKVIPLEKEPLLAPVLPYIPLLDAFCKEGTYLKFTAAQKYREGQKYDHVSGYGTEEEPADAKKAFLLYAAAAMEGYLSAQVLLGDFYLKGFGVCQINQNRGFYWIAKASFNPCCDKGFVDAKEERSYDRAKEILMKNSLENPELKDMILGIGGEEGKELLLLAEALYGKDAAPVLDRNAVRADMKRALEKKY